MENQNLNESKNDRENKLEDFVKKEESKTSLGNISQFTSTNDVNKNLVEDLGFKNIPIENLPSKGLFYPIGTQIAIRSATIAEIKHWSTIDENDLLGMDDAINFVISKCCRIQIPGRVSNWKDIKEIDRLYLLFAIREFTFKEGENKIYVYTNETEKVEVRKEMLNYFNLDEKLMKYYDENKRCFSFELKKTGEKFNLYIPSLGVSEFIKNYVKTKRQNNQNFDTSFIKYASFLFDDFRSLTNLTYDKALKEYITDWSYHKLSVINGIIEMFQKNIEPKIKYNSGGVELEAPLNFQGGIRSIFLISDIFDELV